MGSLLVVASVLCACVPMVVFVGVVWWLDRYHREPVWLIAATFLWGAIGAVIPAILFSAAMEWGTTSALAAAGFAAPGAWFMPVIAAPLIEEPCKAAILALVIWNRHFDNMTDGFVYGATAGLGFAMSENLLYFASVTDDPAVWAYTVVIRTFYSAVMHATATSIVGAALGFARFRGCLWLVVSGAVGFGLAMGVHAIWNGLISVGVATETGAPMMLNLVLFPAEFLLVFVVFQICVFEEASIIRRELREEATLGHIPAGHAEILASWTRRLFSRWVPPGVDRDDYVSTATTLAMRKRQVRILGAAAPAFYRDEVHRLRLRLGRLLTLRVPDGR